MGWKRGKAKIQVPQERGDMEGTVQLACFCVAEGKLITVNMDHNFTIVRLTADAAQCPLEGDWISPFRIQNGNS